MQFADTIEIAAPRNEVWAVTIDVERWSEWTPTVQAIKRIDNGELCVGSQVEIKQPSLPKACWQVSTLEPPERFVWSTKIRGMNFVAAHELTENDSTTTNTLRLDVSGLAAVLLWPLMYISIRRSLRTENQALKQRCEQSG